MKQLPAPPPPAPPPPAAPVIPIAPAPSRPQLRSAPVSSSPRLRPILPTTEVTRQLVRERIQAQLQPGSSHLQKPRPIIPNLTSPPLMRYGAGGSRPQLLGLPSSGSASGQVRVPSTVFVQPVSSSVSLAPANPVLRASSSTHLPAVQLLVSTPSLVCDMTTAMSVCSLCSVYTKLV